MGDNQMSPPVVDNGVAAEAQSAAADTLDATPAEMPSADADGLEETEAMMRLDLDLDRQPMTTPKWSPSGDDPLIIGDELQ